MSNTAAEVKQLTWQCPEHPDAQILHSCDKTREYLNGFLANVLRTNHKYECCDCGRELAAPGLN